MQLGQSMSQNSLSGYSGSEKLSSSGTVGVLCPSILLPIYMEVYIFLNSLVYYIHAAC